jgi:hypothetical protein
VDRASQDLRLALLPYRQLLSAFTAGAITADAFEARFLEMYKSDPTKWPDDVFDVLDRLFAEVDDYVADPSLRLRVGGLSDDELRRCAEQAMRQLPR